jgi:hypothetical protein
LDHTELVEYDTALKQWVDDEISTSLVDFTGATSSTDGAAGQVPAPDAGDEDKFLRGDGTWSAIAGSVTGVKGNAENDYRQGNVNITPANIGLGNVGNFKAVSTVANQGLTSTEQANARANIGAGTSSFSGSYNDLSDKPTIPTVNNATLTIQKNGTDVQTFTANQSSNVTANITVPTAVSELTNDSGYITDAGVTGVKGDSESSYRSGNVNITKNNIGLGNVGNFKAVSTVASQGLSTTEQSNARTNIGAAATADTLYKYNFKAKNKITIACSTSTDGFIEVHTCYGFIVFRTSRDSVQLSCIGIDPDVLYSWTYTISGTTITLNTSISGGTSGFIVSGDSDITVTVSDTSDPQAYALSSAVFTNQKLAYIADVDYVVFKGTTSQWSSLNTNEKAKYKIVILTDD